MPHAIMDLPFFLSSFGLHVSTPFITLLYQQINILNLFYVLSNFEVFSFLKLKWLYKQKLRLLCLHTTNF